MEISLSLSLYLQVNTGRRTEESLLIPVGLLGHFRVKEDDGCDGAGAEETFHHFPRHSLLLREVERGPGQHSSYLSPSQQCNEDDLTYPNLKMSEFGEAGGVLWREKL